MDVTWSLKAFAHAQLPRLDAHQGKRALGQMHLDGDSVSRSTARSPHRVHRILGIRLGHIKEGNARCVLTPSPCGDGHEPAAYPARCLNTHASKNGSVRQCLQGSIIVLKAML